MINCHDLQCDIHYTFIESFHANIVSAVNNACTKPYSRHCPSIPGWNDYVKSFQKEALDWHSI